MKSKKTLKEKIVQSVFLYETKKITFETIGKISILFVSLAIIIIFGGVILDIYTENELGDLLGNLAASGEYSFMRIKEIGTVILNEIPDWVILTCLIGVLMGCILVVSIIKNWSSVSHKVRSIIRYWSKL